MSKLYFYNYNNYYNRIVKKEVNLLAYGTPTHTIDKANFYEADGVNANHTVNIPTTSPDIFNANYLLVLDDSYNIKSRWFVTEVDHNRNRQYLLSLRRDLIVDFYDSVIDNSPVLIEKALVDKNNPLIFNSEGFDFNQIKKEEILLQDNSAVQWAIIYTAKNVASTSVTVKLDQNSKADLVINTPIASSIFTGTQRGRPRNQSFEIWTKNYEVVSGEYGPKVVYYKYILESDRVRTKVVSGTINSTLIIGVQSTIPTETIESNVSHGIVSAQLETDYNNTYPTALSYSNEALLDSMNNKIVEDSAGKYYRIYINKKSHSGSIENNVNYYFAQSITTQLGTHVTQAPNNSSYDANYDYYTYEVTYQELSDMSFTFTLDPSSKSITNAEYNAIAIPLGIQTIKTTDEDEQGDYSFYESNESYENSLAIAIAIANTLTSTACYDIQILPYCPIPNFIYDYRVIDQYAMDAKQYQKIDYDSKSYTLFFIEDVNSTFDINESLNIESYTGDDDLDTKLSNECDMYRIVSPNYNSLFEFSVAKNGGVNKFNVDMTLRPYQPYIHINPNFKNLYGDDFNDSRGLILSGDFSLPIINDAFKQYELQNKNYQLIFDRQIKHMDKENKLNRIEAGFGALTGTIQGTSLGAMAGASGGAVGAIVGGSLGTVASGIGGALDYNFLKRRQNENKDLAIDMFTYNLGNIKALPYSISKINPFSYNYKKFPFIERYSCTDEEKDILLEKIKYNSMTVMSIGYIKDYIKDEPSFIKGTLIRFISEYAINDHEITELFYELKKGVYI